MFDMFDSSNRGWLVKLIEDEVVDEGIVEVVATIVESELVGIIFYSDTMKEIELRSRRLKQFWSKQRTTVQQRIQNHRKPENEGKSEKQREKKRKLHNFL